MSRFFIAAATALALSACSGGSNPFAEGGSGTDTDTGTDTGTGIDSDRTLPPGTPSPGADSAIYRSEPTSEEDAYAGNGYASDISYDSAKDTFTVNNLAFDGDNEYARGTKVSSLASKYAVYEADDLATDPDSSKPISQFRHRAIYGVSRNGRDKFAIVRTGAYVDYGFGGFIYQRDGDVTLPSTGQAIYNGVMAGLRDFNGAGGLEYSTADIEIAIDFDDFDETTGSRGDAVSGVITNRRIFDIDGADITSNVLTRIETSEGITLRSYPTATFKVGPGVMDDNGEILGEVSSYYTDSTGAIQEFETGNYYAIVSGNNAKRIVGVVVLENSVDPIADTVRDTSGFIVYR
ncbi:MAG: hypothetical protein P1U75_03755 [Antarcticimicrobium sp.]|uniref:hypothetical protein n=1 Tax=Antarcticimicrobium sp. TaxID=2824147 RepID=UPI002618C292|nr:hypothetical protein [Antarcticimicrobium sp.]MDF1715780.1 hypothetical protein [Antarcticimicrobium sp.]